MRRVFAELSEIVFQCMGSKESDWWSEIHCCHVNFKAYHVKGTAVKPNPVSCEKISQTFVSLSIVHSHVCNGIRLKTAFFHMHVMV